MKASAKALAGALLLAGSALAFHASAQEQVDMRSTLAGHEAYRQDERRYADPAPAYGASVSAYGRYGMRYAGASAYGGYPRVGDHGDGRSEPRLIARDEAPDGYGRDGDYRSYGGGPLIADRRDEYTDGYVDGGDPRYGYRRDDRGYDGYDRHYARREAYYGSDYAYEPYGYRGGRGYAGPYGYGYAYEDEGLGYTYDDQVDRFSGFVAPPPHDSRDARELRAYCGCYDYGY